MSCSPENEQPITIRRRLSYLLWSSADAATIYFISSFLSLFSFRRRTSSLLSIFSFLLFILSHLLFSLSLTLISSPKFVNAASPPALIGALLKSVVTGSGLNLETQRRVRRSLVTVLFVSICGLSGFLAASAVSWDDDDLSKGIMGLVALGIMGLLFGLVYALHYVSRKRWILKFPIIQRPLFFCFKMSLPSSFSQALKLSTVAFLSSVLMICLTGQFGSKKTIGRFINLYLVMSAVSFSWELSHHWLQVIYTKRSHFAPSQGSAAAETNPSEALLEALEQSPPGSLLQHLAYRNLCIVSEGNVEPWRRAAFFEETGETYRRIITMCLRPIEQLTAQLAEGLKGLPADNSDILSMQLCSPVDAPPDARLHEAYNDFQLLTWCSMTAATLTARSHSEDRYGIAQLTGCNSAVLSKLLSCLLAVEACLGKNTSSQPAQFMGPASIKWATANTSGRDRVAAVISKKKSALLHSKAYAMADVLRTSIYHIVSVFEDDMLANAKASVLEKNWITESKPLYGTRQVLVQKLCLFLEFRAV